MPMFFCTNITAPLMIRAGGLAASANSVEINWLQKAKIIFDVPATILGLTMSYLLLLGQQGGYIQSRKHSLRSSGTTHSWTR
ncbi:hypothetical protein Pelo_19086 [Pelomyxa schiedti]|nr:hypothetical protein Pelo_19086 [Pelomyxa schiedti]